MQQNITYSKNIPVRHEVDVLVAGGGPAGVAAAVSSVRSGLKTFLAEAQGAFGGMGTLGLVPGFCGFGDGVRTLAGGIGVEVVRRLVAAGGTATHDLNYDNLRSVSIDWETLKRVYDDMVEDAGAQFSFFTTLIDVVKDGQAVKTAVLSAKSGLFAVNAKIMIDATGDGDLCALAGAPFEKGDSAGAMMPGSLCSQWFDIDWRAVHNSGLKLADQVRKAVADGVFTQPDLHVSGIFHTGEKSGGGNIGHLFGIDNTDERSLTPQMVWGRRMVLEFERFYKTYLKGYENMTLTQTAPLPGIRETRRIMGDYVLNVQDFQKRAVFDDEIGRFNYPVDIHPARPDPALYAQFEEEFRKKHRYGTGETYGIPYRSLLPRGLDNVYVTGRCVSTDRYIQGSIRVMPGCFITGMAAGTAAALAVENGNRTRNVDVGQLRGILRRHGAYLP